MKETCFTLSKIILYKRLIFRLVQIGSICTQQNKCALKTEILLAWVENIVGKGGNAGYQHFLLFPTKFSIGFFFMVVEIQNGVVKG